MDTFAARQGMSGLKSTYADKLAPEMQRKIEELEQKILSGAGQPRAPPAPAPAPAPAQAARKKAKVPLRQEIDRAPEELERVLEEHEERLRSLQSYRQEYVELRTTLGDMPKKTSHQVQVPLNSVAFMPGQLERTNEVTVLLGDNYFAVRSAEQAQGILDRRIESVDKLAAAEEASIDGLMDRKLTSERLRDQLASLSATDPDAAGGSGGAAGDTSAKAGGRLKEVDIREDFDDPPAPAPAPASARREPEPEPEPTPVGGSGAAVDPDVLYGLTPVEYCNMLDDMETDELLSAMTDFGLKLKKGQAAPSDKQLRMVLRRHLVGGSGKKADSMKGGFFGRSSSGKAKSPRAAGAAAARGGGPPVVPAEVSAADARNGRASAMVAAAQLCGAAATFNGPRKGCVFTTRDGQSGYYPDQTAAAATAAATAAPEGKESVAVGLSGVTERFDKGVGKWVSSEDFDAAAWAKAAALPATAAATDAWAAGVSDTLRVKTVASGTPVGMGGSRMDPVTGADPDAPPPKRVSKFKQARLDAAAEQARGGR